MCKCKVFIMKVWCTKCKKFKFVINLKKVDFIDGFFIDGYGNEFDEF